MLLAGLLHPGPRAFLREYLGDETHTVPFVGREADLQTLSAWLLGDDDRAILAASAGRGKSALLARFVAALAAAGHDVAWIPISLRFGTHRSQTVDTLLTDRLAVLLGTSGHWKDILAGGAERPLLVVLDGLDELGDAAFFDALEGVPLGDGVRLLVAARTLLDRDARGWAEALAWPEARLLDLAPLSLRAVRDALPVDRAAEATAIMERTGGDPLLLRLCLDALAEGEALPASTDPVALVGAWWEAQQAALPAPRGAEARRALGALGAACGVLPWEVLAEVTGDDVPTLRRALATFDRFVRDVPQQGVTFAHPRFADVAAESLPETVVAMRARFATLAVGARQRADPGAYWLHFGLAHLLAADAPDEALAKLVTHPAMLAWRRLEGDLHGLREESEALWDRTAETVEASAPGADGHAAVLGALEHLAFAQELGSLLQDVEEAITPALRAAQVTTGLRSAEAAVQAALAVRDDQDTNYGLPQRLVPLLPLLSDDLLVGVLAFEGQASFPRREIVSQLLARGLPALALEVVRPAPCYLGTQLAAIAPLVPPAEAVRVAEAVIATRDRSLWTRGLESAWAALSLLPETHADEVWASVWSGALAEKEPGDDALIAGIMVAGGRALRQARRGDESAALAELATLSPLFARVAQHDDAERVWGALVQVVETLGAISNDLGQRAEALVDELTNQLAPTADGWVPLLLWRARADWRARGEAAAESVGFVLALARDFYDDPPTELPLPEAWRARVEAAVVAKLRVDLLAHGPPRDHDLETYVLRSRDAFFALVPIWIASTAAAPDRVQGCLCRALARQGGLEGDPRAREALEQLAERGAPVWEIEAWAELWPLERRHALVTKRLALPPVLPNRHARARAVEPGSRRREALPEAHGTRRLRKRLARVIGAHDARSLRTLLACSPPAEHPALLQELLFSQADLGSLDAYTTLTSDHLVALIDDAGLREAAARHLLALRDDGQIAAWPALAIAALPADERDAAERKLLDGVLSSGLVLPKGAPPWVLCAWAEARSADGRSWPEIADENDAVIELAPLRDRLLDAAFAALEEAHATSTPIRGGSTLILGLLAKTFSASELDRALRHTSWLPSVALASLLARPAVRPLVVEPALAALAARDERDQEPAPMVDGFDPRLAGVAWLVPHLTEAELARTAPLADRFWRELAEGINLTLWRLLVDAPMPSAVASTSSALLARTAAREDASFESRLRHVLWSHREAAIDAQADAVLALRSDDAWGLKPRPSWAHRDEPASNDLHWPLRQLARPGLAAAVLVRLLARRPAEEHRANLWALWGALHPDDHLALAPLVDAIMRASVDEPWPAQDYQASLAAVVSEDTAKRLWWTCPRALEERLPKDERELARVRGLIRAYAVFGFDLDP